MSDPKNYRGIPQPVSDFFARVHLEPPLRYSRILDYVKTDKRYLLELRFRSDVDLALFEKFIQNSYIRLIEYQTKSDRQSRIFVIDARMVENGGWDATWRWVNEELPRIGAAIAVRFPQFVLPECRCIIDLKHEGGRTVAIPRPFKTKVIGQTNLPSLYALLKDTSGTLLQPFLTKCEADADFREAMMYCGQALGFDGASAWANLYRAYEVVADRFGGDDCITSAYLH